MIGVQSILGSELLQNLSWAMGRRQRHRARRVREVASQLDVPTLLTPAPSHLSRFCLMCGDQ